MNKNVEIELNDGETANYKYYVLTKERKKRIKYVITGTMGVKQFFWTWFNIIREKNKDIKIIILTSLKILSIIHLLPKFIF